MVKLLLNYDYEEPKNSQESKPALRKKLSRPAFEVKPVCNVVNNDYDDDNDEGSGADDGNYAFCSFKLSYCWILFKLKQTT